MSERFSLTEVDAMILEEMREWIEAFDVAADANEHRRRHLKRPEDY